MATDEHLRGLWAFFSIDIAASTPLKVERPDNWSEPITLFLQLAPRLMASEWPGGRAAFARRLRRMPAAPWLVDEMPAPAKWKQFGDEVVFVQDLENGNATEFLYSVRTFIQVLRAVRRELKRSYGLRPVSPKGTVWLANKARNIAPDSVATFNQKEYLGPGIDIGFRLKSYPEDKKIALSIEAAYLLALGLKAVGDETADALVNDNRGDHAPVDAPVIYLEGNVLRGVFGDRIDRAYPEILLRFLPWRENTVHRRLVNRRGPVTASDLEKACREWIRRNRKCLFLPFRPEPPTGAVRPFLKSPATRFEI